MKPYVLSFFQAPTLYDEREPLDTRLSEIGLATARPMAGVNREQKTLGITQKTTQNLAGPYQSPLVKQKRM